MARNDYAFPLFGKYEDVGYEVQSGMSLRDWFAGMALVGELSAQSQENGEYLESDFIHLADRCYSVADRMMEKREIPETDGKDG